ncbi:hypothetical protein [Acinetobacter colistiniresistens]|uniref:hypothetical protein n=1 Tax=Acinetobacter colistiniresistens TaxID=280145 RepID=UPI001250CB12|nr:hypothetical protein [Acinetobacter colistiniresistens]
MRFIDIKANNLTFIQVDKKEFAPNAIFHKGEIKDYLAALPALGKTFVLYWGSTAREVINQVFEEKLIEFKLSDSEINTLLGGIIEWIKDKPEAIQQVNDLIGIKSSNESLDETIVKYQLFTIYEGTKFVSVQHNEYWITALDINLEAILEATGLD